MLDIPVTFLFKGKDVKGYFSQLSGAGNTASFTLSVDGYYWGQLSYIQGHPGFNGLHAVATGWQFSSNTYPELSEMAEDFGYVITAWIDSHS